MTASRFLLCVVALLPLGGCALLLGNDGDFSLASDAATANDGATAGDGALRSDGGIGDGGTCAASTIACGQRDACLPQGTTGRLCPDALTCTNGSCVDCRPESTACGDVLPDGCGNGNTRGTKCAMGTTCCANGSNRGTCRSGC